jgi:hypothetical protein
MRGKLRWVTAVAGLLLVIGSGARATPISWSFTGTITEVEDPNGVLAANNPALAVGSSFFLVFSFDPSLPPTFPNPYGPGGGVTSWWSAGHSQISLVTGSSFWQTVGPERVDAVYHNPPTGVGLPQAIGSDHWNDAITTDVTPGFVPTSGDYHLNWSINNVSGLLEPSLTPDNFPVSLNLANWENRIMFLAVSQQGPDDQDISYYLEGNLLTSTVIGAAPAETVPEVPTLLLCLPALLLMGFASLTRRKISRN